MLTFLTVILSILLVVNCVFLILLILVQLPKKEAGAGIAFGGGAADALFGAGSGNTLTKLTKYSAGAFFLISLLLSTMNSRAHKSRELEFKKEFEKAGQAATPAVPSTTTATTASNAAIPLTVTSSNVAPTAPSLSAPATNAPAKK